MSAYRLTTPYERSPLERRATGLALALAVNLLLLLVLLTIGAFRPTPPKPPSTALIVDMVPEAHRRQAAAPAKTAPHVTKPVPKPPPVILPIKPTIAVPPAPKLIEMSKDEMAAGDISNLPHSSGSAGDSEEAGRGPHGEVLYNAEWARRPTDAELGGYMPKNAPDGWGLIMCKTIPDNRVDDCVELGNDPPGSHLASAVRQAAWQFRVRPPRKNGVPMIGAWVRIRIDYETIHRDEPGG